MLVFAADFFFSLTLIANRSLDINKIAEVIIVIIIITSAVEACSPVIWAYTCFAENTAVMRNRNSTD